MNFNTSPQRQFTDYILIFLKGMAMGAADVVPGVSGGTIAFISGIYEELITSINRINYRALSLLKKQGFISFWNYINGKFLISLLLGIGTSIFTLARFIKWILEHHPVQIWSFFFGLVLASIFYLFKDLKKWNLSVFLLFLLGAALAYLITVLPPASHEIRLGFLFLCGALAICAMILPGISGAFILLLLGAYQTLLSAVSSFQIGIIAVFALGAISGLLSFSRLLKWLFTHFKNATLATLTGFVAGSLFKIWPWKQAISFYTNANGELKPLVEKNIFPYISNTYEIAGAFSLMCIGFFTIFTLEILANRLKTQK